ncbi:MetQ/NlpA family lipoprotein [Agrobacterium rhizogenes]|uniref:MetQ/NlpA family lipoprotein n=1 Tax=Rhizobium rhizogenes TaxID=359 RepID=UPI00064562B7|nr:MetQ/NlpA family lipoprotein [Rhizobium rhizogenes]OCJ13614.1 metal ABC transporter substrate-binding protein [Agrobacterium sp. B131/95]OCJ16651.1 metal ABC transporter substrate-binding protein [Agrobacterium sp. B133/95]NTG35371.1 MetQ/NlpA family lipoprotein [Rhizobium rhizogenes]NTG54620.1 MetQ/NlpA family lipoprotein [Rhizobium rhizogenes]NTG74693.1 MetQ/NlpA family lipoprotein [Rhizobium rhizogenes]
MTKKSSQGLETLRFTRRTGLAALIVAVVGLTVATPSFAADKTIKVGIISGEDEDVWRVVTTEAAKKGLKIETVVFNDYTQPNEALERGEVDANAFQHQPYLDNQIKQHGYHIVRVGYTGVWPIGLYTKKYKTVAELPKGAVIGVPNDPSNEGRALRVLQNEGVIKLKDGTGILATIADIVGNPKNVEIKELDAGIVGRSIDDLDAAVVNTDWALKSGLSPKDRIAQEPIDGNPYRNFIAVKQGNENEAWVKTLVSAYQNDTVKAEFEKVYKGTGLSAY